ncbi:MAG: hypothetical protein JNJ57_12010 [Saprospiraceae bacterium]|nr:hypothetical protein [Saprospiraceae bacterium]
MAKTPQRKPNPAPKTTHPAAGQTDFFQNVRLQSRLIFALAFLLYANTLRHGFVLDDGIVITENSFTQAGFKGIADILSHDSFYGFFNREGMDTLVAGGRYRPLSLVLFAMVYQFAGANAFVFHLLTVLLFSGVCLLLYRTLLRLLRAESHTGGYLVAWLAAVLFAIHPIHTEVVANIKSCDEILALMGVLGALYFTLRAWDTGVKKWAAAAGVSFFLACMAKENAAAYALLIPLALWFFRPANVDSGKKGSVWGAALPAFGALAAFLLIRGSILPWGTLTGSNTPQELLNNPFLKLEGDQWVAFSFTEKLATILFTLWKYVQLLVLPHPLTHDYYPRHIDIMSFGNPFVLASLALYGAALYWVVRGFGKRDTTVFALLAYLLPLGIVSNLLFPVGTNMSERFVFMPSVGFCLLAGMLLAKQIQNGNAWGWRLFAVAALFYSGKTIMRNFAWESNEKLYQTDIAVSGNSLKLQTAYAQTLLDRARAEPIQVQQQSLAKEAMTYINRALKLYPDFQTAIILRGGANVFLQQFPEAIADYRHALDKAPDNPKRKEMLAFAMREAGLYHGRQKSDLVTSLKYLNDSWQINQQDPETARLIGVAHMVQGNKELALEWYKKGEVIAQQDADALWELGVAYNNLGMPDKARELQQKAYQVDPKIVDRVQQQ